MNASPTPSAPPQASSSFDSFLSPAFGHLFSGQDDIPHIPLVERFPGAVLLVDVSGWTKLVHDLSSRGPEGVERLTHALNAHLGWLLATIHAHGGTVEKFAGDALLALWRSDEAQDVALQRACACAAALVGDHPPADETTQSLALHVGVAGGALTAVAGRAHDTRGFFLLCGAPLGELAAAAEAAGPGEAMLATRTGAQPIAPQNTAMPAARARAAQRIATPLALQLIHPAVAARLTAGDSAAWLAEMRQVSSVFIRLQLAIDQLPDAALAERLAIAAHGVHDAAHQLDGVVHDFLVDDKGVIGIVVFGVVRTHEDDAARAVRAAGQIVDTLASHGIAATAGVATGRAYTGVVGSDARRDFAVIGDPMNLAARLMLRAEDVLCDQATRDAAPRLAFSGGETVTLKGRAEAVRIYRPQAGASAAPREASAPGTLLGRSAEIARLARALEAHCARPAPALVLIEGEAGIGKSTLLDQLVREARAQGAGVWSGAADAIESRRPYHAWRGAMADVIRALAGDAAPGDLTPALATLAERRAEWRESLPLANDIVGSTLPDTPRTAQLSGEARRFATAQLVLGLVSEAARGTPHCLVVEDAHWLASPSVGLLLALLRGGAPLLIVVTTRPADQLANEDLDALVAAATDHLRLGELSRDAMVGLLAKSLGVREIATGVVDFVIDRARGHPFYVEELARVLLESGLVRLENERCELNRSGPGLQEAAIPDTLERLIVSRIDRLGEDDRLVLKVASVLGRGFNVGDLHAVHPGGLAGEILGEHLLTLARRGLVHAAEGADSYAFEHAITRDVSYAMMTLSQRRPLHQRVAEVLEERAGAARDSQLAVLAYHWRAAGVAPKAIDYAGRAGMQALEQAAMREAIQLLADALAIDAEQPQPATANTRARWLTGIGKAQRYLGHLPEARASLAAALRVLERPVPRAGVLFRIEAVARLVWVVVRGADSRTSHAAGETSPALTAIDAYNHLAMLSFFENDTWGSVFCNAVSMPLAGEAGASLEVAHLYGSIANAVGFMGLPGPANRFASQAHRSADAASAALSVGVVSQYTGHLAACLGDLATFDARMHDALAIYDRLGQRRHWEEALINCAYLYQWRGETRRALEAVHRLEASARSRDDRQTMAWAVQGQARLLHLLGHDDEACALAARAEGLVEDDLSRVDLYGHWSLAELRAGREARAEHRLEQLAAVLERGSGPTYTKLSGLSAAVEAALRLWISNPSALRERRLRRSLGALKSLAGLSPLGRARALLWSGVFAWHRGRARSARTQWRRALAAARAMGLALDEALLQLWRAELEPASVDDASLAQAAAVFERAEYAPERERIAALQRI